MAEIAGVIISRATQRVEVAAQNIANMTTAGYRGRGQFSDLIADTQSDPSAFAQALDRSFVDLTIGKLQHTGNAFDLAIAGRGFFAVRSGDATLYTRDGQFSRDADGHLVTAQGAVLQSLAGDVTLGTGGATILGDGTILQDGQPGDRLMIADFADPAVLKPAAAGLFAAPASAATAMAAPQIHQGMLESSNVSTAGEMLSVMAAMRSAESGQRVVQIYDDLMGQAMTAFGQT